MAARGAPWRLGPPLQTLLEVCRATLMCLWCEARCQLQSLVESCHTHAVESPASCLYTAFVLVKLHCADGQGALGKDASAGVQ
mmetsp:Transcript_19485/g.49018  ORF Transcript_19485/g.49018 Transcript_19485/m.49018 type:complete len:83 (-) Transcript_19485:29-277(-)